MSISLMSPLLIGHDKMNTYFVESRMMLIGVAEAVVEDVALMLSVVIE